MRLFRANTKAQKKTIRYFQLCFVKKKEKKNIEKYIKWSDYLILCYSVTNYQSFLEAQEYFDCIHESVKNIHEEIFSNSGSSSSANSRNNSLPVKVLLLGNKIDLGCNRYDYDSI
jgi:GTPase SAR1 family protein